MKLRLGATGSVPKNLPTDLTGHAITIDLSHTDEGALTAELIRELIDRGAAKLVISDGRRTTEVETPHRQATAHPYAA